MASEKRTWRALLAGPRAQGSHGTSQARGGGWTSDIPCLARRRASEQRGGFLYEVRVGVWDAKAFGMVKTFFVYCRYQVEVAITRRTELLYVVCSLICVLTSRNEFVYTIAQSENCTFGRTARFILTPRCINPRIYTNDNCANIHYTKRTQIPLLTIGHTDELHHRLLLSTEHR